MMERCFSSKRCLRLDHDQELTLKPASVYFEILSDKIFRVSLYLNGTRYRQSPVTWMAMASEENYPDELKGITGPISTDAIRIYLDVSLAQVR